MTTCDALLVMQSGNSIGGDQLDIPELLRFGQDEFWQSVAESPTEKRNPQRAEAF